MTSDCRPPTKRFLVLPRRLYDELTPEIKAEFERFNGPTEYVRDRPLPLNQKGALAIVTKLC
jgi:hypothetical protein